MHEMTFDKTPGSSGINNGSLPTFRSQVSVGNECWDVQLVNSRKMAELHQETFKRHPIEALSPIPAGMFVKVHCIWPIGGQMSERFWVEITDRVIADSGIYQYFGELRNRTLLANYGGRIGPMTSECFCDIDIERYIQERSELFADHGRRVGLKSQMTSSNRGEETR